jgi:hypothetical protein
MQMMKVADYTCRIEYRGPVGSSAPCYSKSWIEISTQKSAMLTEGLMVFVVFFSSFTRTPAK